MLLKQNIADIIFIGLQLRDLEMSFMELKELCEKINLPSEAKKAVLEISLNLSETPLLKTITDPKTAKSSYWELKNYAVMRAALQCLPICLQWH